MPALIAPLIDLVVVVVFAAIGRNSHSEGDGLSGVFITAWPFLTGVLVGWVLVYALRRRWEAGMTLWGGGIVVVSTVAVGMILRHLTDRGVAVSFIIVSLVFNGAVMLGWRGVRALVARCRRAV